MFSRPHHSLLIVPLTASLVAGCASAPSPEPQSAASASRAQPPQDAPSMGLADLARRDVEAFLTRRQQLDRRDVPAATEEPHATTEILWHRPVAQGRDNSTVVAVEPPPVASAPLYAAAPEMPEVHASPAESAAVAMLGREHLQELLAELSRALYEDATYSDVPLRELLLIAATSLVRSDRALSPDAIPGLTERERELLSVFQRFFADLGTQLRSDRGADEVLRDAVDLLRASLHSEPRLALGTMALCTRVGGFGDYDPFNKYVFLAHTEQQAIVYLEMLNFTSEKNVKNEWVTELSQQITIYSDRDGIPVWREEWQTAADVTKNRRNDFFVVQVITLPKALSVGKYHLKIRVRDEKSKAETEGSIPFEIVADPKMTATIP